MAPPPPPPHYVHSGRPSVGFQSTEGGNIFRGTHGIVHPLSPEGYRPSTTGTWKDGTAFRVLSLGCSYVFGYGLEERETWPSRFAELVGREFEVACEVMNLGVPGASNDFIMRQVIEALEALRPHVVLLAFAQKERLEYWETHRRSYTIRPGAPDNLTWSARRREIQRAAETLSDRANDLRRLYQAIKIVSTFARVSESLLVYTYASVQTPPVIAEWLPTDEYVGIPFPRVDFAADDLHPGPRSNELLAIKSFVHFCRRLTQPGAAQQRAHTALGIDVTTCPEADGDEAVGPGSLERWRSPA